MIIRQFVKWLNMGINWNLRKISIKKHRRYNIFPEGVYNGSGDSVDKKIAYHRKISRGV